MRLSPIAILVGFESVPGFSLSHLSSGNTGIFPSVHINVRSGRFAGFDIIKRFEGFQRLLVVRVITAVLNDGFDYFSIKGTGCTSV
jgi:hypothetical protein